MAPLDGGLSQCWRRDDRMYVSGSTVDARRASMLPHVHWDLASRLAMRLGEQGRAEALHADSMMKRILAGDATQSGTS